MLHAWRGETFACTLQTPWDARPLPPSCCVSPTRPPIPPGPQVKAVVLRVNSPGGSALASAVIARELQLLAKEKPLVVSMGDVAASGERRQRNMG